MICSSAIGFDPRVNGKHLTFGFEGIWQGTAVLYDHQTHSLWMHLTGECFRGPLQGTFLRALDTGRHTTWADWRRTHPSTDVLAVDPGLVQSDGPHAYFARAGARSGQAFLPPTFPGTIEVADPRLLPHALVYGVTLGDAARAYPFESLKRHPVVEQDLGGTPISVWFDARSRSAAAYRRTVNGRVLSFRYVAPGRFEDRQTQSRWTLEGRATKGPLRGTQLGRVRGLMSEWYGWRAHYPDTLLQR